MTKAQLFDALFSRPWPTNQQRVQFALRGHGYGDDDGYYGVTYPDDLDDYAEQVEKVLIPSGWLEIAYWDGGYKEMLVAESEYLKELHARLSAAGETALATELGQYIEMRSSAGGETPHNGKS